MFRCCLGRRTQAWVVSLNPAVELDSSCLMLLCAAVTGGTVDVATAAGVTGGTVDGGTACCSDWWKS